ncbi:hypothetical protein F4819DRAFT_330964 [Hypoxylon fuscum]|nr:hypothetical protein F4819DRAFT_330964 [Hypoxylon fuscum]
MLALLPYSTHAQHILKSTTQHNTTQQQHARPSHFSRRSHKAASVIIFYEVTYRDRKLSSAVRSFRHLVENKSTGGIIGSSHTASVQNAAPTANPSFRKAVASRPERLHLSDERLRIRCRTGAYSVPCFFPSVGGLSEEQLDVKGMEFSCYLDPYRRHYNFWKKHCRATRLVLVSVTLLSFCAVLQNTKSSTCMSEILEQLQYSGTIINDIGAEHLSVIVYELLKKLSRSKGPSSRVC